MHGQLPRVEVVGKLKYRDGMGSLGVIGEPKIFSLDFDEMETTSVIRLYPYPLAARVRCCQLESSATGRHSADCVNSFQLTDVWVHNISTPILPSERCFVTCLRNGEMSFLPWQLGTSV